MNRVPMVFLLSALVVGCQDRRTVTSPPGGLVALISDGAHAGGNPDFFFRPPLVGNPASNPNFDPGEFDPGLRPVVRVFREADGCAFTGMAVYGPVVAPVDIGEEQYHINWNTRASNLVPGTIYRICVFSSSAGTLLGFLDVAPIAGGMRNARTGETYAFQDDRTLPIKFRIETGALCAPDALECAAVGGVVAAGDTIVLPSKHAAVVIPSGAVAVGDSVTITIAKQAPPYSGSGETPQCLPGDLVQAQGCYHFSTEPANYQFLTPVRLEACVNVDSLTPGQADALQLFKYNTTDGLVALPRADTTEIDCSGLVVGAADANAPTSFAGAVWRGARRFLANMVSPHALYAAPMATPPKGLGGLAGSFSDVGAAVAGLPDLTLDSLYMIPGSPNWLDSIEVTVQVRNLGYAGTDTTFYVNLELRYPWADSTILDRSFSRGPFMLGPLADTTITFTVPCRYPYRHEGSYFFKAEVDSWDMIFESDEANNTSPPLYFYMSSAGSGVCGS